MNTYPNSFPTTITELPIETLQLSPRVYNALMRAGYTTIGTVIAVSPEQLATVRNIGILAINELQQKLTGFQQLLIEQGEDSVLEQFPINRRPGFQTTLPPEVLSQQLTKCGLSNRTTNALSGAGIYTVADLLSASVEVLTNARGLGQRSRDEIQALIVQLSQAPNQVIVPTEEVVDKRKDVITVSENEHPNLVELIVPIARGVLVSEGQERRFDILKRRYGLDNSKVYTLQDIGEYYDLTRERVRQLEQRAFQTVRDALYGKRHSRIWRLPPVVQREIFDLTNTLEDHGLVLRESELFQILEQRYEMAVNDRNINNIRFLLILGGYRYYGSNEFGCMSVPLWIKGDFEEAPIRDILNTVDVLLADGGAVSFFDIKVAVNRKRKVRLDNTTITFALSLSPKLESLETEEPAYRRIFAYLESHADRAFRVLTDAGQPMHLRDIARRINQRLASAGLEANIPWRSIQGQIVGDSRFKSIGRSGLWALTKWEHIVSTPILDLMRACLHHKGSSASAEEIFAFVRERRPDVAETSIKMYLSFESRVFVRVGLNQYELAEWGNKAASTGSRRRTSSAKAQEPLLIALREIFEKSSILSMPRARLVEQLNAQTGFSPMTIYNFLNQTPYVRIEPDQQYAQRKIAFFEPDPIQLSTNVRRTPREQAREEIVAFLEAQPGKQALLSQVVTHVLRQKTLTESSAVYYVISRMQDQLERKKLNGKVYYALRTQATESALHFPLLEQVANRALQAQLERAVKLRILSIITGR